MVIVQNRTSTLSTNWDLQELSGRKPTLEKYYKLLINDQVQNVNRVTKSVNDDIL